MKGKFIFGNVVCSLLVCQIGAYQQLMFTNSSHIFAYNFEDGKTKTLVQMEQKVNGTPYINIFYHESQKTIYWSNLSNGTISRLKVSDLEKRCSLTDTTYTEVIIENKRPVDFAIDSVNGHIYWADMEAGALIRSQLDGTEVTIVLDGLFFPVSLVLDIPNRLIYYFEFDTKNLSRCGIDGSNNHTLFNSEKVILKLALDHNEQKLYWIEWNNTIVNTFVNETDNITETNTIYARSHDQIKVMDLAEMEIEQVVINTSIFDNYTLWFAGIAVDESSVYFSGFFFGVYELKKNEDIPRFLVDSNIAIDLKLVSLGELAETYNSSDECTEKTLINTTETFATNPASLVESTIQDRERTSENSYSTPVSVDATTVSDQEGTSEICSFKNKEPQVLYSDVKRVFLHVINSGVVNVVNKNNYTTVISVDIHYDNGDIFWIDFNRIYRKRCNMETEANVIHEGHLDTSSANIGGFAVDSINNKVYWTEENTIYRTDLDGNDRTSVLTNLSHPRKVVLDTSGRWIYFSEESPVSAISKCKFDGSDRQTIIHNVLNSYGMAIDYTDERLYWSDAAQYHIKSSKLDGSDIKLMSINVSSMNLNSIVVMGLDVFGDYVYVSELGSGIYRIKKNENYAVPVLITTGVFSVYDLRITTERQFSLNGAQTPRLGFYTMTTMLTALIHWLVVVTF